MGYGDYIEIRRPVKPETAKRLDAFTVSWDKGGKGDLEISHRGAKFIRIEGKWFRESRKKDNWPSHWACMVFGGFTHNHTRHNFVLIRYPLSANWHKELMPAVKRLLKKVAHGELRFNVDPIVSGLKGSNDANAEFDRMMIPAKYDYQDGEFVETHPGKPK